MLSTDNLVCTWKGYRMHEMKSFVILYTVFVVLGVFNQFVLCAARPDDEQTQSSIQQVRKK